MEDIYVIIPGCSDLNRGDQALAWETKKIAEEAGFKGDYYLTSERNEPTEQSEREELRIIAPLLEHPSRKFAKKSNISYSVSLKIKWGVVAFLDFLESLLLLNNVTRKIIYFFLSPQKQKVVSIFMNAKAIFMKGGGLLQTYGGLSSTYSMYFWVYPILMAHKLKIPVYIMPNSYGPFEGPFVKKIVKKALKKCRFISSRETKSQGMLSQQLSIESRYFPDLAFTLRESSGNKQDFLDNYRIPPSRKLVALTMRPYRFPKAGNPRASYKRFQKGMKEFIGWLYDNNFMPVIVEHTLAINAHENDGACIAEVTKYLDPEEYRLVSDKKFDCRDLKTIYGYCDYIVGTRFHSVIFSFGNCKPGIAIAYTGNKTQGIMHDIGLDDYVIDIYNVNSKILIEKFVLMLKNEIEIKEKLGNYVEYCYKERQELVEELMKEV